MPETSSKSGVNELLALTGADREAKAYAFLYAAFKRTEISSNPVRDALDCLTPFVIPYLNTIPGKQVHLEEVKGYLARNFGFDIPLYAVEQLIPSFQRIGAVEWSKTARIYVAKKRASDFVVAKDEIETAFDEIVNRLSAYAGKLGFPGEPSTGTWDEALINFLKTKNDAANVVVKNIKGVLLDPIKVEKSIIASFIRDLHERDSAGFEKLLNVFMGILIEEFIASIAEVGTPLPNNPVHAFYDTAVLLRLLGCSGRTERIATEELTRYLQDLGFRVYYLSGNEAEVAGILDTIIYKKDSGQELEGETAEAIIAGEVTLTDLRMLQNTFPERLAAWNIFPGNNLEQSALLNAAYQIDERGFADYLLKQSLATGKPYKVQNRNNDAGYLGTIMRLRRKMNTRDVLACGFLFITTNRYLAQISRRYLIEQKVIKPQHCAPFLSVGQVATIAWLMKDHRLAPEKAGRELLSNCYAAVRPDAEWFKNFREGFEKVSGSVDEAGKEVGTSLTLQAARRIAQEESFGNPALVRELNMAEILSRAEQERFAELARRDLLIEEEREKSKIEREALIRGSQTAMAQAAAFASEELERAKAAARAEGSHAASKEAEAQNLERAGRRADFVLKCLKLIILVTFIVLTAWSAFLQMRSETPPTLWTILSILAIFNILSLMDLLRVRFVTSWLDRARSLLIELQL